ncbi:MAG: hypothetical protein COY75_07960 [Nitrospirae bacterium CG_4_10_14_0_8_um_filter_41_23]|nr:MAG: hypothetical protein COV68_10925 [Nitrospirae bacterium CG11_big_fil_rev_8_21_14_0_20_41_14]PIV41683.1 MAG: hypothetical protein COS27_09020 [Nitrospirae bacterium CG02_land_8_20_14_3_00_41_53]PIW88003.1 MAG: hypothetical protein COZ94_02025 [Nitrospirae bacterium CG_4_8_14_3_um_filter_41_47]PIY86453.1 MAG: hypothetical protein COY75_07960 [Nitrospirae bacterium CG_4_10_14_0_8_um_filter_41_23]PJA80081.1 MAG: hypothetical protein CO148_04910 [Nitrospirae bacterium CG_4_9_14_3_um_filter_4
MASSSRLKPGEKGNIIAKIGIKGRAGSISKSVQIFSNDPEKKVLTLILRATIQ